MDSVRARISFSDNFSDLASAQRRCLILIPRNECTTVNALKEYIRNKFSIEQKLKFELSVDGYVLPEWESSEIIRENDTLCVFVEGKPSNLPVSNDVNCSKNKRESKSKKRRKSEHGGESEAEPAAKKAKKAKEKKMKMLEKEKDKKRKKDKDKANKMKSVDENPELSQEPQDRTQKDADSITNFPEINNSIRNEQELVDKEDAENVVATNGGDEDGTIRDKVEQKYNEIRREKLSRLQGEDEDEVQNGNGDVSPNNSLLSNEKMLGKQKMPNNNDKGEEVTQKKRRKRKRKKKAKSGLAGNDSVIQSEQRKVGAVNGTIHPYVSTGRDCQEENVALSNELQQETPETENKKSSAHIVFESDVDSDKQSAKVEEETLESTRVTNLLKNNLEEIVEGENISLHHKVNDNIEMQEDGITPTNDVEQAQQVKEVHKQIAKNYGIYPPLNGPPRNGDIIAFKTLELSSEYTPEVSEFKEGVVTNYDHKTQQVNIQLTTVPGIKATTEEEDQREGRFEMELDEDWTTDRQQEQETALMSTYLSSLIDLKLIT